MPGTFFTPTVFCSGGILLASGGANEASSSIIAMLPLSTGAAASWVTFNLTKGAGAIGARAGHRLAEVGGIIYAVGGLDSPGTPKAKWSNVVFAMDAASAIVSNSTSGFVKLIPAGSDGMFSPRGSFSLDVLGGTVVMFGGLTRNPAIEPFTGCSMANAQCTVFNEVRPQPASCGRIWGGAPSLLCTSALSLCASSRRRGVTPAHTRSRLPLALSLSCDHPMLSPRPSTVLRPPCAHPPNARRRCGSGRPARRPRRSAPHSAPRRLAAGHSSPSTEARPLRAMVTPAAFLRTSSSSSEASTPRARCSRTCGPSRARTSRGPPSHSRAPRFLRRRARRPVPSWAPSSTSA